MKVALVNPRWTFDGSIYFGCREPHLPLELGYARQLLRRAGHKALLLDGHLFDRSHEDLARDIEAFGADMTVIATAPTYLFWRCAPPELRVPAGFLQLLGDRGGLHIAVGPHGSTTPRTVLRKLGVDGVIRGECEETIVEIADCGRMSSAIEGLSFEDESGFCPGQVRSARFANAPALQWDQAWINRHHHHHHRFDGGKLGKGAEVEASRGCPYACTFCAKIDFRDAYRRRARVQLLAEIDDLIAKGVGYLYFIDEIFLPDKQLLDELEMRAIQFGVQTRIDLWSSDLIDRLGRAGCVSVEAGVESLTEAGRDALAKKCRLGTDELASRLIQARRSIRFVQANLIATTEDDAELVRRWRENLAAHDVWANEPVPLYPYPSSPDYRRLFGEPTDDAWEKAHTFYLSRFDHWSDIQAANPLPLHELERRRT